MYSRCNVCFGKIYKFYKYESEQFKNVTHSSFWTGPSLNLSESQPITSNYYENNYRWRRVDFWCLSSGGIIAPARFRKDQSAGCAISVSVWLNFFHSRTFVVCNYLSSRTWPWCRTLYWWSKLSSLMLDDTVHSPGSSIWSWLISWLVSWLNFNTGIGGSSDL